MRLGATPHVLRRGERETAEKEQGGEGDHPGTVCVREMEEFCVRHARGREEFRCRRDALLVRAPHLVHELQMQELVEHLIRWPVERQIVLVSL